MSDWHDRARDWKFPRLDEQSLHAGVRGIPETRLASISSCPESLTTQVTGLNTRIFHAPHEALWSDEATRARRLS